MDLVALTIDEAIRLNSINYTLISLGILFVLLILSVLIKQKSEILNYLLFGGIALVILANSIYLVASTLYLNNISTSKGPVHHHADFEIWDCGKALDLVNPEGWSNKIGTSTYHEHNDKRLHIEGVIVKDSDVNLGRFFEVIGGELTNTSIIVPTIGNVTSRKTGDLCENGEVGELQVFLFKTNEEAKSFTQQKLADFPNYVITPFSQVPPGDCLIIEFGASKDRTDKLCEQYEVKKMKGEITEVNDK